MIHSFVAAALRKSSRFPIPDIVEGSRFMFSEPRKTDYLDAVRVGELRATKERLVKVLQKQVVFMQKLLHFVLHVRMF